MVDAFYRVLAAKAPNIHVPYIVILVGDEAETYRPEMEWITRVKIVGVVHVFHPDAVMLQIQFAWDRWRPSGCRCGLSFLIVRFVKCLIAEYLLGQCGSGNAKGGNLLP